MWSFGTYFAVTKCTMLFIKTSIIKTILCLFYNYKCFDNKCLLIQGFSNCGSDGGMRWVMDSHLAVE